MKIILTNRLRFVKSPRNLIFTNYRYFIEYYFFRNDFQYVYLINGLPILNVGSSSVAWLSCNIASGICSYSSDISKATNFFINKLPNGAYQLQVFNSTNYLKNVAGSMSITSDSSFQWTKSLTICQLSKNQFYFNAGSIQISTVQ